MLCSNYEAALFTIEASCSLKSETGYSKMLYHIHCQSRIETLQNNAIKALILFLFPFHIRLFKMLLICIL